MRNKVISVRPYLILGTFGLLVLCYGYFTACGIIGASILGSALLCLAALVASEYFTMRKEGRTGESKALCASAFVVLLLIGEFGVSTDSQISFLISIWRFGVLFFFCYAIRLDSDCSWSTFRRVCSLRVMLLPMLLIVFICIVSLLQLFFDLGYNEKGVIRSILFYVGIALSIYCAAVFIQGSQEIATVRSIFRWTLAGFLLLAFFEMTTGFHLPTSWLNSTSETAMLKLAQIGSSDQWITATGPFFNPNNFCLFLSILACLSLPASSEKGSRKRFGLILFFMSLLAVAVLGSTIVSIAMLVSFSIWRLVTAGCKRASSLLQIGLAVLLIFLGADCAITLIKEASTIIRGQSDLVASMGTTVTNAATVTSDLGAQMVNYKNETGSMWARVTLYQDLVLGIMQNPFGVGGGGIHSYLSAASSESGLIDPHSWILEFTLCYGWIPALLYLGFNVALVVGLLKQRRKGQEDYPAALCAALCASYIASFAPSASDFNTIIWIPVILSLAFLVNLRHIKGLWPERSGADLAECSQKAGEAVN